MSEEKRVVTVSQAMEILGQCPPDMQLDAAVEGLLVGIVTSIDAPPQIPLDAVIVNITPSQPQEGTPYDVLMTKVNEYLAFVRGKDYHPDRVQHYLKAIEEAAVKMIGGEDVYDEINQIVKKWWSERSHGAWDGKTWSGENHGQ